jgi:hypothetical protein
MIKKISVPLPKIEKKYIFFQFLAKGLMTKKYQVPIFFQMFSVKSHFFHKYLVPLPKIETNFNFRQKLTGNFKWKKRKIL